MKFSLIVWKGFYYCGFHQDMGSLWGMNEQTCHWIDTSSSSQELDRHIKILTVLENIPLKDIEIRRIR